VLHGERSDLLSRETCERMAQCGPKAKVAEIKGVGHAPTLLHRDQIELVKEFLLS
jgi:pimeloyl-ACP methyl ester carboxylesterase